MAYNTVDDASWVRRIFYLPKIKDSEFEYSSAYTTGATQKWTDTSLGGNIAINSPPQFTKLADPAVVNRGGGGMGRYYSENIDDAAVHLHLRAGVPKFNALTQFFIGSDAFYDPNLSYLARTGRTRSFFYTVGKIGGFLFTAPLQPVIYAGKAVRYFADGKPSSRWYNLKPTMPLYWAAVNNMVNTVAVNMGVIPPVFGSGDAYGAQASGEALKEAHRYAPDIFLPDGGIDMYAVANKAQRMTDAHYRQLDEDLEKMASRQAVADTMKAYIGEETQYDDDLESGNKSPMSGPLEPTQSLNLKEYLKRYIDGPEGQREEDLREQEVSVGEEDAVTEKVQIDDASVGEIKHEEPGYFTKAFNSFWANNNDAAEFITFNVRSGDSVSESVSNSARESEMASTLNSMSGSGRTRNFSFAGGNVGDNVAVNAVESVGSAVKDMAMGALDAIGLSGLAAFNGAAFVDIPKYWEDSSVTFPRMSYKIELRSPYGHPLARLQNEIIPMLMILGMALPRATGKQSYTGPFLVEAYCQGRGQVRLGLIDSLTITRGVNNMPWSKRGEPRGIDIDVSIMDLSSIMSMPLDTDPGLFDDENAFTDYMATLGGLSLGDQIYQWRKFNLNLTRALSSIDRSTSAARVGAWVADTWPARLLSGLRRGPFYQ